MKLLKFLRRQWDKLEHSPGLQRSGSWFVSYAEGKKTQPMTYDTAKNLQELFGGKICHIYD